MRRLVLLALDLFFIVASILGAQLLRDNLELIPAHFALLSTYVLITTMLALPIIFGFGLDRTMWRFSGLADYQRVVTSTVTIVAASVTVGFLVNRHDSISRSLPLIQLLLMVFSMIGARVVSRMIHRRKNSIRPRSSLADCPGLQPETVLLLGLNATAELYVRALSELSGDNVRIAGLLGRESHHTGRLLQQYPVLGTPEEIDNVLQNLSVHGVTIDRVVITSRAKSLPPTTKSALIAIERASNLKLDFLADRLMSCTNEDRREELTEAKGSGARDTVQHASASDEAGASNRIRIGEVERSTARTYWQIKRGIDFTFAATIILILLPVFVVLALMVAIDIGFPAVFWQQRPGRNGRPFRLYKFRTMAAAHDEAGNRIPDSQRVSSLGRLMRRWRVDELPQLFNILFGDMSFVGPRPLLPVDQVNGFAARLLVAPGLTGWAQVHGGRTVDAVDKAALDIWYICNASLMLDVKIVLQTLPMLILGDRADMTAVHRAWSELLSTGVFQRRAGSPAPLDMDELARAGTRKTAA